MGIGRFAPALAVLLLLSPSPRGASGADFRGHVDVLGGFHPNQDLVQARVRFFAQFERELGEHWYLRVSGHADGVTGNGARATAGIVRPLEAYFERRSKKIDLLFGFKNLVWGVLDEIQPQDVVNPLDVARFALFSRVEARLPVPMARIHWFASEELSIEALLAPIARAGTFDQLDEATSPFAPDELADLPSSELDVAAANMEGGVRVRGTNAGIDWGASVYRDVVDFDRYELSDDGVIATRPRRWMLGADLETARGRWVLRGEGAIYLEDPLQVEDAPIVLTRWSFLGGAGADRRVGESVVFVNALYRYVPEEPLPIIRDEISLVGGVSREFSMGSRNLRVFGIWNALADSAFIRAHWSMDLFQNTSLEIGAGAFLGDDGDFVGFLRDSDFVSARLRLHF